MANGMWKTVYRPSGGAWECAHTCVSVHAWPPPTHTNTAVDDTLQLLAPGGLMLNPVMPRWGGSLGVPCHRCCPILR